MPTEHGFDAVKNYMRQMMTDQLDKRLCYHSLTHTFDDVLPAAEHIATLEQIDADALVLVQTAAVFHDAGFITQRDGHEEASVQLAHVILPRYGYDDSQISLIAGMINATRIPQSPQTLLEKILADADLDVLGRDDFTVRNQDLRDELAAFGTVMTDEAWFTGQLKFVRSHQYFTSVREIHSHQKQRNIQYLEDRLRAIKIQDWVVVTW